MEEVIIEFETAKLAKEKGFNRFSKIIYNQDKTLSYIEEEEEYNEETSILAPTQVLLQSWLRVEHNIEVNILSDQMGYMLIVVKRNVRLEVLEIERNIFERYEDALEEGLLIGLKNIE